MNNIRTSSIQLLSTLQPIDKVVALNKIEIFSLLDLSEHKAMQHASILIGLAKNDNLHSIIIDNYLSEEGISLIEDSNLTTIYNLPIKYLLSVDDRFLEVMVNDFLVNTLTQLANFPPYLEAKNNIQKALGNQFKELPSAPNRLIPELIGSTHTTVRFSNYVKEKEYKILESALLFNTNSSEPAPEEHVISAFYRANFKFNLGYLAGFKQKWINAGMHLGEIVHSIALAPGESRNISFIDWNSRQTSSRTEDTEANETLASQFLQNRALNEVVVSTAQEHQTGRTDIDSSTQTSGYGKTTGFGAAVSAGVSAVSGEIAGSLLGSVAGSTGKSIVESNSQSQGTLITDSTGTREVLGEVTQNISDSTIQNSSNIRSLMSTVVVEDEQSGSQNANTRNITNYNHSHALTMQYFEVLNEYKINTAPETLMPILYLPFNPIDFNFEFIKKYWGLLSKKVDSLVTDSKFKEFNEYVLDYKGENGLFTFGEDTKINKISIRRSKSFTNGARFRFDHADPEIVIKISANDLNNILSLTLSGSDELFAYPFLRTQNFEKDRFGESYEVNNVNIYGFEVNPTGGRDTVDIGENIRGEIISNFKAEIKKQLKNYLQSGSGKIKRNPEADKEDNEVGDFSNLNNLRQMVDEPDGFELVNDDDSVSFSINLAYELVDVDGNTETVYQSYSNTYTFGELYRDQLREGETNFDIRGYIRTQMDEVSDVNSETIFNEILSLFNQYKYGFTKHLLKNIEREQVIDLIERLAIRNAYQEETPLTDLIDPAPVGIVDNLMLFKLKRPSEENTSETSNLFFTASMTQNTNKIAMNGQARKQDAVLNNNIFEHYTLQLNTIENSRNVNSNPIKKIALFLSKNRNKNKVYDYVLILSKESGNSQTFKGETNVNEGAIVINYSYDLPIIQSTDSVKGKILKIDVTWNFDFQKQSTSDSSLPSLIKDYYDDLKSYKEKLKSVKSEVFLPTSGVFGEAILGLSNASEYINIKRFYNWQDSPIPNSAPGIDNLNINSSFARSIDPSINPNIPVSVLNQINPQQLPENSLQAALGAVQNGDMFRDMSKSQELVRNLGELAKLANTTAQTAGTLSGKAGSNALNAAIELGKVVADMINQSMGATNISNPPNNPTEKGGNINEVDSQFPVPSDGKPRDINSPEGRAITDTLGINPGTPNNDNRNADNEEDDSLPNGGLSNGTGSLARTFTSVEIKIESLEINGGTSFSDYIIDLINIPVGAVIGDIPSWVMPEVVEAIRPGTELNVKGVLILRNTNGSIAEQRDFKIKSSNCLAYLVDNQNYTIDSFKSYNITLTNPISQLSELHTESLLTMFVNGDIQAFIDFFGAYLISPLSILGLDELNFGSMFFGGKEIELILSNWLLGNNSTPSKALSEIIKLRDMAGFSGLPLLINDRSLNIDIISPDERISDILAVYPLTPPQIIIL